jgi:hypothetical protein
VVSWDFGLDRARGVRVFEDREKNIFVRWGGQRYTGAKCENSLTNSMVTAYNSHS